LWLRSVWGLDGRSQFSYSIDGRTFTDFGEPYQLQWGSYRGDRIGIYSFNNKAEAGYVACDSFTYRYDSPANRAAKPTTIRSVGGTATHGRYGAQVADWQCPFWQCPLVPSGSLGQRSHRSFGGFR